MGRAHKLFDGFFLPKEFSPPPPKKKERKKEKEIGGIGGPSHFYLGEISPPSAEIGVFAFNKVKNGPKRSKSSVFRPKIPVFFGLFGGYPSHFYLFHFTICKYCCVVIISVPVSLHITIIDNIQGLIKTIHSRLLL